MIVYWSYSTVQSWYEHDFDDNILAGRREQGELGAGGPIHISSCGYWPGNASEWLMDIEGHQMRCAADALRTLPPAGDAGDGNLSGVKATIVALVCGTSIFTISYRRAFQWTSCLIYACNGTLGTWKPHCEWRCPKFVCLTEVGSMIARRDHFMIIVFSCQSGAVIKTTMATTGWWNWNESCRCS